MEMIMLENIFEMQSELNDYVFKKNNIKDKLGNDLSMQTIVNEILLSGIYII